MQHTLDIGHTDLELSLIHIYRAGELSCNAERSQSAPDAGGGDLSVWLEPESEAGGGAGAFLQNQHHSGTSGDRKNADDSRCV